MVGRCWGWRYLSAEQSWPAFAHRLASNRLEFPGGSEGGQARSRSRRVDGSVRARDFDERQKLVSVLEQLTLVVVSAFHAAPYSFTPPSARALAKATKSGAASPSAFGSKRTPQDYSMVS